MSELIEVRVPDIGDFKEVPVIEVMVGPGDAVKAEDSLITLESDKATLDVPSPAEGTVRSLAVKVGDKVSKGSVILLLESRATPPGPAPAPVVVEAPAPRSAAAGPIEVKVPDIGDFKDVPVIDVAVAPGARVKPEDTLITLESDKATMDVPSPAGGLVRSVAVKTGDRVSEGSLILALEPETAAVAQAASAQPAQTPAAAQASAAASAQSPVAPAAVQEKPEAVAGDMVLQTTLARLPSPAERAAEAAGGRTPHASPSVRRLARELGVDLAQLAGSGPKGRILAQDVQAYVKRALAEPRAAAPAAGGGLDLLPWPKIDFSKFGPVESKPLARIQKISGANLARNWVMIPHVTQFDEADITELEAFRARINAEQSKAGVKLTALAFLIKACVAALARFPQFNASLDGENLVLKKYFHIGFAADTPNGLVVPIVRDADRKGVLDIARETAALAARAREGKLAPADMQGGCFSISSLGGIGGIAFTPIINAPEVAILGVSRTSTKPVWDGTQFVPRQMLPLSLSYDHRVIDGAAAARFTAFLGQTLADLRRVLL